MKRLIIAILLLLTLCGCSKTEDTYPRLIYRPSCWSSGRQWVIYEGYELNDGHSYDIIDTDDGYDVVLHFVEEAEE